MGKHSVGKLRSKRFEWLKAGRSTSRRGENKQPPVADREAFVAAAIERATRLVSELEAEDLAERQAVAAAVASAKGPASAAEAVAGVGEAA